jgi:Cysteine-rich secretory protein family
LNTAGIAVAELRRLAGNVAIRSSGNLGNMCAKRAGICCVWFFLAVAMHAQVGLSPDDLKAFNLLNSEREKAGLPKLQWDYRLAEAARAHTQLQAQNKKLSHQFLNERVLGDRIGATGVRFDLAAENVAEGATVQDMHDGLMYSPPHRANILNHDYSAVGLAVVNRDNELYLTQDFARVLPVYSEEQFRSALVTAFNKARKEARVAAIGVHSDFHMHELACSGNGNPRQLIQNFQGATNLVVYTSSIPDNFPADMKNRIVDGFLHHMEIGVCFRPDSVHGYGAFWVVAAFYP